METRSSKTLLERFEGLAGPEDSTEEEADRPKWGGPPIGAPGDGGTRELSLGGGCGEAGAGTTVGTGNTLLTDAWSAEDVEGMGAV